jgi:hypothetical protein
MKRVLVVIAAFAFALGTVSICLAAAELHGTIAKIEGNKITVRDDKGKEMTIEGNATGLKIGDKVTVGNGKVLKEWGASNPKPRGDRAVKKGDTWLNPQPEPPMDPRVNAPGSAVQQGTPEAPKPPPSKTPGALTGGATGGVTK